VLEKILVSFIRNMMFRFWAESRACLRGDNDIANMERWGMGCIECIIEKKEAP
jgi:hypothetical protein